MPEIKPVRADVVIAVVPNKSNERGVSINRRNASTIEWRTGDANVPYPRLVLAFNLEANPARPTIIPGKVTVTFDPATAEAVRDALEKMLLSIKAAQVKRLLALDKRGLADG